MSRLIKSQWAQPAQPEKRVIGIRAVDVSNSESFEENHVRFDYQRTELLEQAKLQADMIIQEAAVHAKSIREQIAGEQEEWGIRKRELEQQAREEGLRQGVSEGRDIGYQEYLEMVAAAKALVEQAREDYGKQIQRAEKTILELGIHSAGKILGNKLHGNEEEFLSIVKRALKEARDYREVQLHIHPVHYGFLLSQKDELLSLFPKESELYIYPDEDLSETDCIIESGSGRIDAGVDSQLEEIKRKLTELLESECE